MWLFVSQAHETGQTGSRAAGYFSSQVSQVLDAVSHFPPPTKKPCLAVLLWEGYHSTEDG